MITRKRAKVTIKERGWSQRKVAPFLGVTHTHLNLVLNGKRESRRLLAAIEALPTYADAVAAGTY